MREVQAETGLEEGHNTEAEMKRHIETVLFGSRWVLVVFYVGLIVAMCVYALFFLKELAHMVLHQGGFTKESMLMSVLELVDITMIGNLVKMIITGIAWPRDLDADVPGRVLRGPERDGGE